MIAMIGTSDRLCWLAETCKILLLLLVGPHSTSADSGGGVHQHVHAAEAAQDRIWWRA